MVALMKINTKAAWRSVKDAIVKCIIFRKLTSKFADTPFVPLPKSRIENSSTFNITGVGLAGLLYLKEGEKA